MKAHLCCRLNFCLSQEIRSQSANALFLDKEILAEPPACLGQFEEFSDSMGCPLRKSVNPRHEDNLVRVNSLVSVFDTAE